MKNMTKKELSVLKNKLLTKKNIESDLFNSNIILNGMKELKLSKKAKAVLATSLLMLNLGLVGCGDDAKEEPINESVTEEEIVEEENEQDNEEIENEREEEVFRAHEHFDENVANISLRHGYEARDIFFADTFISETTGEEVNVEELKEKYGQFWRMVLVQHYSEETLNRLAYQVVATNSATAIENWFYIDQVEGFDEAPPIFRYFWYVKPNFEVSVEEYSLISGYDSLPEITSLASDLVGGNHGFPELEMYEDYKVGYRDDKPRGASVTGFVYTDSPVSADDLRYALGLHFYHLDLIKEATAHLDVEFVLLEEVPELLHDYFEDVDEFLNNVNNSHSYFNGARTKKL